MGNSMGCPMGIPMGIPVGNSMGTPMGNAMMGALIGNPVGISMGVPMGIPMGNPMGQSNRPNKHRHTDVHIETLARGGPPLYIGFLTNPLYKGVPFIHRLPPRCARCLTNPPYKTCLLFHTHSEHLQCSSNFLSSETCCGWPSTFARTCWSSIAFTGSSSSPQDVLFVSAHPSPHQLQQDECLHPSMLQD